MKNKKRRKQRREKGRRGMKKRKSVVLWERAVPTGYWLKKREAPGKRRKTAQRKSGLP